MAGWLMESRLEGQMDNLCYSDDKSAPYLIEILLNMASRFSLADSQDFLFVFAFQRFAHDMSRCDMSF